jgi:hypothetical protein
VRLTWGAFYALLFLYRCLFSVLGETVIMRITEIPDTHGYQHKSLGYLSMISTLRYQGGLTEQWHSDIITGILGAIFGFATGGSPILINMCFQALAFLGLWRFLSAVPANVRGYLAILVMFPSFTVWSSIASKEAVVVFLLGVLCGLIVDIYRGKGPFKVRHALIFLVLYIYKPHFAPALLFLAFVPKFASRLRQPAAVALLVGTMSLVLLYFLAEPLDRFARTTVQGLYGEPGRSTRDVPLIREQYDFFTNAPEGMLLAFIGPTPSEASSSILHFFSLIESLVLIAVIAAYIVPRMPRMPAYLAFVSLFAVFWVMLANYPTGIANPGTAVRYRTDWLLIIYLATIVLASPSVYFGWRASCNRRKVVKGGPRAGVKSMPAGA